MKPQTSSLGGLSNLLDLEEIISNIEASFEFLEKLEYCVDTD